MTLFLAVFVAVFVFTTAQTPNTNVADVSSFKKLRSWGESSLYQIEAPTNYVNNPYLIHLVGNKYGTLQTCKMEGIKSLLLQGASVIQFIVIM